MAQQLDLFYDYLGMPREKTVEEKAEDLLREYKVAFVKVQQEREPYQRIQCCG